MSKYSGNEANRISDLEMTIYIGVGSNIRADLNIIRAIRILEKKVALTAASTFYETLPEGGIRQVNYINGVLAGESDRRPLTLRRIFRRIERKTGRRRGGDTYASRQVDLDLLMHGDRVIKTKKLDIPDRHIADRPYLSVPLMELDPDLRVPGFGVSIRQIVENQNINQMRPLEGVSREIRRYIEHE